MASFRGTKINPDRFHISQLKFILLILPLTIVMLLPIIFIISHAFKPLDELYAFPPRFFVSRPTLDNFRNLFTLSAQTGVPFSRYLFNSIIVVTITILLTLLISSLAAFGLSKLDFKGKKTLFAINQFALMFVAVAVAIPRFMIISEIGIMNTYLAHIIPLLAMPVGIFLLKQFIDQIPNELLEAARIDGANRLQIYYKVVVPLIKPALATVAILSFQLAWVNTETSTLYVDNESLKTLPYYMSTLILGNSNIAAQGMSAAASFILFVPNLILFIILQGKVMNTMAHSGIK